MSQSLVAKEIQCSDLLRPKSQSLFLSLGSNPYRITWLRRVRAGVKRSRNLWSLPSVPKFSACLLSVEKLSEKWEYAETKANRQRRPNNNSLVIKNDQPGLNLGLSHCRQILYHLSHQGSPYTWDGERVFDKDSSRWVSTAVSLSSREQPENTKYLRMTLKNTRLSYSFLYLKDQPYIDFFCRNSQLVNGVCVYVCVYVCMYVCVCACK